MFLGVGLALSMNPAEAVQEALAEIPQVPVTALLDENGNPILDEDGNYILEG